MQRGETGGNRSTPGKITTSPVPTPATLEVPLIRRFDANTKTVISTWRKSND
jgi:hypothetical protein